jgi:thiamine kinase-like enzyme
MLASLHQIPVSAAEPFLHREEKPFSEDYTLWMLERIAPYLPSPDLRAKLDSCFRTIQEAPLKETISHGDFCPHQVIVDLSGRWVLMDFEYATITPFADDLSGAEVRLERRWRRFSPSLKSLIASSTTT